MSAAISYRIIFYLLASANSLSGLILSAANNNTVSGLNPSEYKRTLEVKGLWRHLVHRKL